jgi:hypothetical protein
MKRAVVIGFATWAAFAVAYYALLRGHMRYAVPASIAAGLFMATVVGTYRISIADLRDARRLREDVVPSDGDTVAATGTIRVDGAPLRAPFSGRPAALYVYDIEHDMESAEGGMRAVKDYSGFALAAATVEAFHGPVRLGGFPQLEGFDKERDGSPRMRQAAEKYVAATAFEDLSGFAVRGTVDAVRHMIGDAVDSARKDWKLTDGGVTKQSRVVEQVVEPGERVVLIGHYAGGRVIPFEGITPRLVRGAPDSAAAALRWKAKQQFIVATAIAIGINFFVSLPFLLPRIATPAQASSSSASTSKKHTPFEEMYGYHEAIRRGDLGAAQQMAARGTPVNVPDLEGKTPLAIAADEATAAWLLANGADANAADEHGTTVLMEQATLGHGAVVKLLIAKGARLDDVDPRYHMSALQYADYTEHLDVAQILRDAGAHDDTVTEKNGTPLGDDDPPVRAALAYLDALFANDRDAMSKLWLHEEFDDADLAKYRSSRPHPAHLWRGFSNDRAATLELRGKDPDGGSVTWRYDLSRVGEAWKIRDERWETRYNGIE